MLPESRITNAYFAAFITSFVRATLGEVINSIPASKMVFSCTTDGFLANLSDSEIHDASQGEFCTLFRQQRLVIAGDNSVLEKKHYIRKPLGWRTRGQATLMHGKPVHRDGKHILLARGGVSVPPELEETDEQNEEIIRLFMTRTPNSMIHISAKTGIRDTIEQDADFVDKSITKRLSMEFDWKRRPHSCTESSLYGHLVFSTVPWQSLEQFVRVRELLEQFQKGSPSCFKTLQDLETLSQYVETNTASDAESLIYLRKTDGDLKRLRQMLCVAFKNKTCGLEGVELSEPGFATILNRHGIKCSKADVQNGKKIEFIPHYVPPTQRVIKALESLKQDFWHLDPKMLLSEPPNFNSIIRLMSSERCEFISKTA